MEKETPPHWLYDQALHARRAEIRRGLSRVNTASVAVVLVTIGLAIAAGFGALRAGREAELAQQANDRAREELWKSYLAQARAGRLSGVVGRKAAGLAAVSAAAAIRPSLELRNEAIAHLASLDLEPTGLAWTNTPGFPGHPAVDHQFLHHLESDANGTIRVHRISEPAVNYSLRTTNGFVASVEIAPGDDLLAVIYENSALTLWDLRGRTNVFERHGVAWVSFSEDGQLLAIGGADGAVSLLDTVAAVEKEELKLETPANLGRLSGDGRRLAVVCGRRVELWDLAQGQQLETFVSDHAVFSLAMRGNFLAAGDVAGEVHLRNLMTRRERPLQAHQDAVHRIMFSPRADLLVSASYDGSTKGWDPYTGRLLLTTSQGTAWKFSADGRRLLFRTQEGWRVWRVSQPQGLRTLDCTSGPQPNVWHVDFSEDGQWLAATKQNGVALFRTADGWRSTFQPINQGRTAYFLSGGTDLLTTTTERVERWPVVFAGDKEDPQIRLGSGIQLPFTNFAYLEPGTLSMDRKRLALPASQTEVAILDLPNGKELYRLTNGILPRSPSFSRDGRWIATGTFHGKGTTVWDAATGQPVHDFGEGNASAFFAPDGRHLLSAGSRRYQLFETGTWKRVFEAPTDSGSDLPNRAAFSADGVLLATVRERRNVQLQFASDWTPCATLIPPVPQVVTWLACSPDHRLLAAATSQDLVQLWDLSELGEYLEKLGLGWNDTRHHLTSDAATAQPRKRAWPRWHPQWTIPVVCGAIVVIACTGFIRERQRRLLTAYIEVDQAAELQNDKLRRAQNEVLHAQKMKALGTLSAGVAHDFNNLLSVIRLSNQLTAEAAGNDPEVRENAAEIEQAVLQGKKLVHSMLGYSRDDVGDSPPFSLVDLVEDTVALLTKQFLSGIELTLNLDQEAPLVRPSRSGLEQVLLNLVINASEAMNGQGRLTIAVKRERAPVGTVILRPHTGTADYCLLSIKDTGPGIAPELIERIFEPFFTTKNRGTERGTGLGLSLVYRIAETEGMGIQVESAPGEGAEFQLLVPVANQQDPVVCARESHSGV